MGISRYSALVIQNPDNDIRCEVYAQDKKTKKWASAANIYHGGHYHTTLVSTQCIFDTPEIAVSEMEKIVEQIKKADVS